MNWNTLLFLIFPYIALTLFIAVTIYRSIVNPFSVSSMSSQLLEGKKLYWGSISFHYGIIIVLLIHLLALLLPKGVRLWNAVPIRLYILELTGFIMALWSLAGLLILIWRRVSESKVRAVTTPMDLVVLGLLLVSMATGMYTATAYRFGSTWFTGVLTPYIGSLLRFNPQPELVGPLPWMVQLHVVNFFIILAVFPFSRLIHILTFPLGYLFRPWQIVIWMRRLKGSLE